MNTPTEINIPGDVSLQIILRAISVKPWCKNVATAFDKEIQEFHSHNYSYWFGSDVPSALLEQSRICYAGRCACFTHANRSKESPTTHPGSFGTLVDEFLGEIEK